MNSPHFTLFKVLSVVCIGILLLAACEPNDYVDVTQEAKYKKVLGAGYVTKKDIRIIGVTFDANYKKKVDYVFLVEKPGFSGPEVVFSENLKKGTKIKIEGVYKSKQVLSRQIYYKVKIEDHARYDKYVVLVYDTGNIENEDMGMDSDLFKKVDNS